METKTKAKTMTIIASILLVSVTAFGSVASQRVNRMGCDATAQAQDRASALSSLIRSLGASDADARAAAACRLGKMHDAAEPAIPSLIKLLADTTEIDFSGCDDSQNFKHNSRDSEDPETVGKVAAVALSQIGKAAIDPLIETLRAPEVAARANSAFALGLVHDERVVEPLVSALSDADFHVRKMAAWSLGLSGDSRAVGPLAAALKDSEWQVRSNAAWSLGLKGDGSSVEPLVGALSDQNARVQSMAAWALGLKGDSRAVEPLTAALQSQDEHVRSQAAWALGLKGDNRAVDGLMAALKDQSGSVRSQAAWALGLKGDQRAAQALADAMKDQDAHVRKQASWALGMIMMRGGDFSGLNIDTSQIKVRKK
jgi:HEAT repeat protein